MSVMSHECQERHEFASVVNVLTAGDETIVLFSVQIYIYIYHAESAKLSLYRTRYVHTSNVSGGLFAE